MKNVAELDDLYDGDHKIELDERYSRGELIGEASVESNLTSLAMLSAELNNDKYKVRSPSQQAEWTKKKSSCQKQLAKYLLRMDSVVKNLIVKCESAEKKLFGVLVDGPNGICIKYDMKLKSKAKKLLSNYLDGVSEYSIDQISHILVEDYNLSYCHFIKPETEVKLKEFADLKSIEKMSTTPGKVPEMGSTLDLFPNEKDKIAMYAHAQGLTWDLICGTMRSVRILHFSISQFKERLVSTNLRSCISTALKYYNSTGGSRNSSLGNLDLVSEASIGLMHACDMYVDGIDARFTTYATFWIKLKVSRYIKNTNPIRIPIHVTDEVVRIIKAIKEISADHVKDAIDEDNIDDIDDPSIQLSQDEQPSSNLDKEVSDYSMVTQEQVEAVFGTQITSAVWLLAQNRLKGVPIAKSCTTTSPDEDEYSFDLVIEPDDCTEDNDNQNDGSYLFNLAKSLVTKECPCPRNEITEEQYEFVRLNFVNSLTPTEIAKMSEGDYDSTYVRKMINQALAAIRTKLEKLNKQN